MKKVEFKDGIPTCPCGSQEFNVAFKGIIYYDLDASKRSEGWGTTDRVELGYDRIEGIICSGCNEDIEVTPGLEEFIRKIV